MSEFSFLPWVRQKLAKEASASPEAKRPTVTLNVRFSVDTAPPTEKAALPIEIYGPGDVVGLNATAILKTLPAAGEQQFPPHLLAGVEFYEEDLPWRYSPKSVSQDKSQLEPWCWLLVVKQGEAAIVPQTSASLPVITVHRPHEIFPNPAVTPLWAWAHTQANQAVAATTVTSFLETDLQQNPDLALSRILCPRHLEQNTAYRAYVVPVYELGRRAGIGSANSNLPDVGASRIAWLDGTDQLINTPLDFPVYYQWEFHTGAAGDFETLARRLRPVKDADFIARTFDVVVPTNSGDSATVLRPVPIPTALVPVGSVVTDLNTGVANYLYEELQPAAGNVGTYQRPILTPPVYGRYYHSTGAILSDPNTNNGGDWKDTANLDVRYRAIAGLGAKQLQDNQEDYVQRAWEQVKDVLVANTNLRGMQSGLQTTLRLRQQHLPVISTEALGARTNAIMSSDPPPTSVMADYGLHLTGMAWKRVLLRLPDSTLTLQEVARQSSFPLAALSPAFRRLTKPFGTYQTSQAGRPRRPSLPEEVADEHTLNGTSLKQRDSLLSLIATGKITAATSKEKLTLTYQFDDTKVDQQFATNVKNGSISGERLYDGNGNLIVASSPLFNVMKNAYLAFGTREKASPDKPIVFESIAQPRPELDLEPIKEALIAATDPKPVFLARANRALRLVPHYVAQAAGIQQRIVEGINSATASSFQLGEIKPVMAYPIFKDPMGDLLRRQRPDLFLPGLENFPDNSVVLFEANQQFVEAYLLGLNHAMGTELLWREYPTDLRGSYFRQFWDVSEYRTVSPPSADPAEAEEMLLDVDPLATWGTSPLGKNDSSSTTGLYVAIRAELLRRFPNTIVCAQKATKPNDKLVPSTASADTLFPIRRLAVGQDILVFEFALTKNEVLGTVSDSSNPHGYFFSLLERPGEPHFGLDEISKDPNTTPIKWDDLSWEDINTSALSRNVILNTVSINTTVGFDSIEDAAQLAYAMFQQPSGAAIHARELIQD